MQKTLVNTLLFFLSLNTLAGFRTPNTTLETGVFIGSSYYLGELNPNHFIAPSFAFGPKVRYNYDERISLRTAFTHGLIKGNDASSTNSFKQDRNFSFSSRMYEIALIGEFNFLPYTPVDKNSAISTPFLFLGFAIANHNPKTTLYGKIVDAKDLNMEGAKYAKNIFSIPIGVGLKMAANRLSFELTWGIRKTYSDYLDDVSKNYKEKPRSSSSNNSINYTQYASLGNVKRGDQFTKDWYVFSGLSIMWSLSKEEICRDFK